VTRAVLFVLALAVMLAACGTQGTDGIDVASAPPAETPAHDAFLADGAWPEVAAFVRDEQRPVIVNLFASWCGPCRAEAPVLRRAAAAHDDVAFLGVAHQDNFDAATRFLEEEQLPFPTLFDPEGETSRHFRARGMPVTAFFAADGRLAFVHVGILTEPMLASRIADLRADARR
jgi:thiol-disulfide isomerase/thioredoxin